MSMLGLMVGTTSPSSSTPLEKKRVRMSLRLLAQMSWAMGTPMRRATQPLKMLPKFPLGTENDTAGSAGPRSRDPA